MDDHRLKRLAQRLARPQEVKYRETYLRYPAPRPPGIKTPIRLSKRRIACQQEIMLATKNISSNLNSHSSLPGGDHSSPTRSMHGHTIMRLTTIQVCSSPAGRVRSGKSRASR